MVHNYIKKYTFRNLNILLASQKNVEIGHTVRTHIQNLKTKHRAENFCYVKHSVCLSVMSFKLHYVVIVYGIDNL